MNQILAAALLACMAACTSNQKKEVATTETTETEAATAVGDTTALAMTGTFEGIFPAASCEGIRASLTINADSTYTYKREYIGEKDGKYESSGIYHLKMTFSLVGLHAEKHPPMQISNDNVECFMV